MSDHLSADVEVVVQRFLDLRRSDRRASIDQVLDEDDHSTRLRADAIREIARRRATAVEDDDTAMFSGPALPDLEGYDLIDELGRGGMGVVYEAYQRSTGRRVAVKFLLDATLASEQARRRFEREVELIARLEHPRIVSVIDSGIRDGQYFYVMDYFEGEPLDIARPIGELDPVDAATLLESVCEAVDYAHQRGVLHRDLKPSNIMVDRSGEVRLLDFGLAKVVSPPTDGPVRMSLSEPGQIVGTVAYMAPEQARGDVAAVGIRTDVYALGAIGYELITGRLPVETDGPLSQVLQRIETMPPPRPSAVRRRIPADIDAILLKCLEKNPARRYPTAGELARDLERYRNREPVEARRPGPAMRISRWVSRNRLVVSIVAAALLVLIVVSGVLLFNTMSQIRGRLTMAEVQSDIIDLFDPNRGSDLDRIMNDATTLIDKKLAGYPLMQAELQMQLGDQLIKREAYERAQVPLTRALGTFVEHHDEDHLLVADARHELARTWFFIGMRNRDAESLMKARAHYEQALATRQVKGAPLADIATTTDHLASTCAQLGLRDLAIDGYEKSLALRRELFGDQHIETMKTRNNLAWYHLLNDDPSAAEPLLREVLAFVEGMPEADRPQDWHARTLHALGRTLVMNGAADDALPFLELALSMKEGNTGRGTLTAANTLSELARAHLMRGDLITARDFAREAINIRTSHGASLGDAPAIIENVERLLEEAQDGQ